MQNLKIIRKPRKLAVAVFRIKKKKNTILSSIDKKIKKKKLNLEILKIFRK